MADQTSSPPPSDDELRETLDLLSTVMASVSNRVDTQTKALDQVNRTATEARQAAFAAKAQTDPKHYGDLVGQTIDGQLAATLQRLDQASDLLGQQSRLTVDLLQAADKERTSALERGQGGDAKAKRFKRRLPWFGLGAVVVVLALSVALLRFMTSYPATCAAIGGVWSVASDACVFYRS